MHYYCVGIIVVVQAFFYILFENKNKKEKK